MAYTFDSLRIVGYRDEFVPNTFLRQEGAADHVAILFPGANYTCHMPLLYYATQVLLAQGADALWVEYAYGRRPELRAGWSEEHARWLYADVTAACQAAVRQREYGRLTFVGKSLGTLAMAHLLTTQTFSARVEGVWLTPLLKNEELRTRIMRVERPSLLVIGTADPHYDRTYLTDWESRTQRRVISVEGAGHTLEIEGDWRQSLKAIELIMRAIGEFVQGRPEQ